MKTSNSCDYIRFVAKENAPSMAWDGTKPLDQWQKEAHEKLSQLLGLPLQRCDEDFTVLKETKTEGYTRIDFEFQSEPGYYVPCSMLIPAGAEGPIPTAICLQGHSSGMHISVGEAKFPGDAKTIAGGRDFAVRAVKEGFCAIAMEQRYMGSSGQTETGSPACLNQFTAMAGLLMGRTPIGERVWDIMRLIDTIEKNLTQYVDTSRIICMGNSGGGTATFYAACMEPRIHMAIPSCALCTYDDSIMAVYHCPCNFIPGIRQYFNMGDLGCLIAPRRLVVVCGVEDRIFPVHGVEASFEVIQSAYEQVGKAHMCKLIKGQGGHQFYPDEAWPVAKSLMALDD